MTHPLQLILPGCAQDAASLDTGAETCYVFLAVGLEAALIVGGAAILPSSGVQT